MKKKKCFKCGYWSKATAEYCGLCYEPFNKPRQGEGPRPPAAPAPVRLTPLALKAAAAGLLAAAALAYLHLHPGGRAAEAGKAPGGVNRFAERTAEADRLFAEYEAAKSALLADISAAPPAPEEFGIAGDYTRRLFDIEGNYAAAVERLGLPPAAEAGPAGDSAYLEWLQIHRHREARSVADFGARYQKLVEKAGVGR